MAHTLSALKRMRQSRKRAERNRAARTRLRTQIARFLSAARAGQPEKAEQEFRASVRLLDRAARKGLIHPNKAARLKSRLARLRASPGR